MQQPAFADGPGPNVHSTLHEGGDGSDTPGAPMLAAAPMVLVLCQADYFNVQLGYQSWL